jgi:hypothetical protein
MVAFSEDSKTKVLNDQAGCYRGSARNGRNARGIRRVQVEFSNSKVIARVGRLLGLTVLLSKLENAEQWRPASSFDP